MRRDELVRLDAAASDLRRCARAFTRRNLYHAWLRTSNERVSFESFERNVLAERLGETPIPGLLPLSARWDGGALGREWAAYFPRSIVIVDALPVLDLFIASGVMTTARMAVVCIDGSPAHVVDWLRRGFRAGHRAPIGYLHDAATAFYPFAAEPLASLVAVAREPIDFVDLGLPVRGALARKFPLVREAWPEPGHARVTELEALPPCAMLAWAARQMMGRVPGDPEMAPLVPRRRTANDPKKERKRP